MTHRTIVIADHHKSVFVCATLDRETGEVQHTTLASCRADLEPFLRDLPGPVLVYVEACRAWEWVSDLVVDLGHDFRLVNPREMPEIAKSAKKSDRRDVEAMLRRFQVEGDLPQSRRLSRDERTRRAISRERSDISKNRRRIMLRIHALIDGRGMPAKKDKFACDDWREEMKSKLAGDEWMLLETLLDQFDHSDTVIQRLQERLVALAAVSSDFELLKTIPGFGPLLSSTVVAEVPDISIFGSAKQFASFIGLVPRVRSSAGHAHHGKITKSGPSDLRWAITQAIVISGRCKQPSAVTRMYHRKRAKGKPAKVAICAAANKLARVIYAMLSNQTSFSRASA
jgi:transposase